MTGLNGFATEDRLKAFGAAAASAGAVGLFHILGVTPEAPDMKTVTGGAENIPITPSRRAARESARGAFDNPIQRD